MLGVPQLQFFWHMFEVEKGNREGIFPVGQFGTQALFNEEQGVLRSQVQHEP
jgi:hypothetical protein